jgi:spore germination protein GerM
MSPRIIPAAIAALLLATACRQAERKPPPPPDVENRVTTRAVVLYYEGPDGLLAPERREMPLPESATAAIRPLVAALVAGPKNPALPNAFPEGTIVRGAFVLPDGTAVVDLGGPILQEGWQTGTHAEMSAAYALVQTLVENLPSVSRVQILLGGELAPTLGGHLDLSRPLRPKPDLLAARVPPGGGGAPAAPAPRQP